MVTLTQLLFLLEATAFVALANTEESFVGDKLIRVVPRNNDELEVLISLENHDDIDINFWKRPHKVGLAVDMHVKRKDYGKVVRLLHSKGIVFTIVIVDIRKAVDEETPNKSGVRSRSGSGFRTDSFHTRYHRLFQLKGKPRHDKPKFFINCGIHAREWISPATCMYMIKLIASKYGKDQSVTAMLDKMDFIIMPVLNVDGYVYTWKGKSFDYRFWRKTLRPNTDFDCIGTDPNRNWGYTWGKPGSSPYPCDEDYRGTKAFSEIEVKNVADFLESSRSGEVKAYIDIHAYGQLWMIPWGVTETPSRDHEELMHVSKAGAIAIMKAGHGTFYEVGSSSVIIYPTSGSSKDYTYGSLGIKYSFLLELRDRGRHGFLLPPEQIIPTGLEMFEGIKAAVAEMKL